MNTQSISIIENLHSDLYDAGNLTKAMACMIDDSVNNTDAGDGFVAVFESLTSKLQEITARTDVALTQARAAQ